MRTIEYDKDGWICNRPPYNITDPVGELEVTDEIYEQTLAHDRHFAWKVDKGEVYQDRYELYTEREIEIWDRISELKRNLSNTDYVAIKFFEGWITEEEYASIKAQRQAWRDEINELEQEDASFDELPNEDIEEEEEE